MSKKSGKRSQAEQVAPLIKSAPDGVPPDLQGFIPVGTPVQFLPTGLGKIGWGIMAFGALYLAATVFSMAVKDLGTVKILTDLLIGVALILAGRTLRSLQRTFLFVDLPDRFITTSLSGKHTTCLHSEIVNFEVREDIGVPITLRGGTRVKPFVGVFRAPHLSHHLMVRAACSLSPIEAERTVDGIIKAFELPAPAMPTDRLIAELRRANCPGNWNPGPQRPS